MDYTTTTKNHWHHWDAKHNALQTQTEEHRLEPIRWIRGTLVRQQIITGATKSL
jgi:hypothetical protein